MVHVPTQLVCRSPNTIELVIITYEFSIVRNSTTPLDDLTPHRYPWLTPLIIFQKDQLNLQNYI